MLPPSGSNKKVPEMFTRDAEPVCNFSPAQESDMSENAEFIIIATDIFLFFV
jgi:hypothetical protein